MKEGGEDILPYEEVQGMPKLKHFLEEKLEDYNMEAKLIPMDLVLFDDAIKHICRIHRMLRQPRGNMMLVGVGGSGRQSLTRLASFVADINTFTIEITKQYRSIEFHEDLKSLYMTTGCENKVTTFLFNDTQIKVPSFLEDINNILSSGEVPNLFPKEELGEIYDGVRKDAVKAGLDETPKVLWKFFIDRVRANLHVILAMSPIGPGFRTRCRMYPGLVNCTTIDYFHTWPADALQEVAKKFLADINLDEEKHRDAIAKVFAVTHLSVIDASAKMVEELSRYNYVTPTNYLELVKGYLTLLAEKRSELGDQRFKLSNGLQKLEESKEQVEVMSVALEKKKIVVASSQKECEELLVIIVSERRIADEQKKTVEADSERIGKEEKECLAIASDAEADLAVAMPALEKAMLEVDKLDKSSISELKAYNKPPPPVEMTMQCVMTMFGRPTDWANAKKAMGEATFLASIKGFDKNNIKDSIISKVKKFINNPGFTTDAIAKVSVAAGAMCVWCHAIYLYAGVSKEVAPKRARLKNAQSSLAVKQKALKEAQDALAIVVAKVNELNDKYTKSMSERDALKAEAELLEDNLTRAEKLINGLSGEYTRWQASVGGFEKSIKDLVGDSLIASGFLSYAGPFDTVYRDELVGKWIGGVKQSALPFSENFSFSLFLAKPTDVRDWNIQGLPKDNFSTENGVITTRCSRWPLMIDPQGQANKWVREMEGDDLKIIDLKMKDFLRDVENAITYGLPVLLQDVLEELDPSLEPVLSKAIIKVGNRSIIKLGDKELDYSEDFKLYEQKQCTSA
jgi:dynein heavy chain